MTSEKPKVRNIRIRVVDNGFIVETSPFTDGSGSAVMIYKNFESVVAGVQRALEK